MDKKEIYELYQNCMDYYNNGQYAEAIEIVRIIQSRGNDWFVPYTASGLLIDLGVVLEDETLVREGIDSIEDNLPEIEKSKDYIQGAYYNLANGYSSILKIKRKVDPYITLFNNTEAETCKKYYRKALKYNYLDPMLTSQILVNLGNIYDSIGRVVEALECMEMALKYNPKHGMAKANKAEALIFYSRLIQDHQATFLNEAHELLEQAFVDEVNPEAKQYYKNIFDKLENLFETKRVKKKTKAFPGIKIKGRSKREQYLIKYCIENKLYLNYCNHCQQCDAAVGDNILIRKMIVPLHKESSLRDDKFLQLSSYLNQIKQDYVTARLLLVESQNRSTDYSYVDKYVTLIDACDYSKYHIYVQLLTTSYKLLYDTMDKVAYFINEYLHLGINDRNVNFTTIWYSDVKERKLRSNIVNTRNISLSAIYNIQTEILDGEYKVLRRIRNKLTHSFLKIKSFDTNSARLELTEQEMYEYTLQLTKLVKSIIIYLLIFVTLEESKKEAKSNEKIVPIFARNIEDAEKYDY